MPGFCCCLMMICAYAVRGLSSLFLLCLFQFPHALRSSVPLPSFHTRLACSVDHTPVLAEVPTRAEGAACIDNSPCFPKMYCHNGACKRPDVGYIVEPNFEYAIAGQVPCTDFMELPPDCTWDARQWADGMGYSLEEFDVVAEPCPYIGREGFQRQVCKAYGRGSVPTNLV